MNSLRQGSVLKITAIAVIQKPPKTVTTAIAVIFSMVSYES